LRQHANDDRICSIGVVADMATVLSYPKAESVFTFNPIGHVSSPLIHGADAPKQGQEGAPSAWLVFRSEFEDGLRDLTVGEEILLLTWLDRADRATLRVHPRDNEQAPLRGVFSTRSQDRPNPIGIHRVKIVEIAGPTRFKVLDLEAFDGTPIIDVKPVLDRARER
jgi:tRNA-Thr(GGU) m(6)t(6)A37 methyltransferase TsaA